jgi:hypothetical protein
MAFTFPLAVSDFQSQLRIRSVRFDLERYEQESGTAIGDVIRYEIAPPKWTATCDMPVMTLADARRARALLRAVADYGSGGTFNLYDPAAPYPAKDPTGSIIGSSTVTILERGGRAMRLTGLPASYDLSRGDLLSVSGGSYRGLVEVGEDVSANGSGVTGWFNATPMRSWMAVGNGVDLKKPVARMCLRGYDVGMSDVVIADGVTFIAVEVR